MSHNDVYVLTRKGVFTSWLLNNYERISAAVNDDNNFEDFDNLYEEVSHIFEIGETDIQLR